MPVYATMNLTQKSIKKLESILPPQIQLKDSPHVTLIYSPVIPETIDSYQGFCDRDISCLASRFDAFGARKDHLVLRLDVEPFILTANELYEKGFVRQGYNFNPHVSICVDKPSTIKKYVTNLNNNWEPIKLRFRKVSFFFK